ncbi:MAG: energy-coupling factor transporter transmembrane protein EcfT [Ruminococcus sp.]|nr:energy-coupling factor transporter transmembrane protein EcfT [Ruminococcus sp.]
MDKCNPITVTIWFLTVITITMFSTNPIINSLSFLAAVLFSLFRRDIKTKRTHLYFMILLFILTLVNPLVSRQGATVLFFVGDKPMTLEALIYGFFAALMLVGTLYWFRSYTEIMSSEKLLYLFGKLSSRLSLILSMSLRYVPLFCRKAKEIDKTQRTLGLYADENVLRNLLSKCRVCTILFTWALENGIWTADSMAARGYGMGRRTHFSMMKMHISNWLLCFFCLLLWGIALYGMPVCTYYPQFTMPLLSRWSGLSYLSFGMLLLLPFLLETVQRFKSR